MKVRSNNMLLKDIGKLQNFVIFLKKNMCRLAIYKAAFLKWAITFSKPACD